MRNITRIGHLLWTSIIVFCIPSTSSEARRDLCLLPFAGKWAENDRELLISDFHWGNYGSCEQKVENQYLFKSNSSRFTCFRCLIVFPVHRNVLQFKSTSCISDDAMDIGKCRERFRGDAQMNTIFKSDASPVRCPIETPLNFTFSTSHGTCSSRTSTVQECSYEKRLRIQYEACPELPNREAKGEEIECVGGWQSMGSHFFAARIVGKKNSFRCFIIDRVGSSGRIGVSADSSCQELSHLHAAATILNYRQDSKIEPSCDFPHFLSRHSPGSSHSSPWHSVATSHRNVIHRGKWTTSQGGRIESTMICLSKRDLGHSHYIRVFVRKGCNSGYMCIKVVHKHDNVAHILLDEISPIEYSECDEMKGARRETIVRDGTRNGCAVRGRHYLPSCPLPVIESGCEGDGEMRMRTRCEENESESFDCVVHWSEADVIYSILRHPHSHKMFCHVHSGNTYRTFTSLSCDSHSILTNPPNSIVNISYSERCDNSLLAGFLSSSGVSTDLSLSFLLLFLFR